MDVAMKAILNRISARIKFKELSESSYKSAMKKS